MSNPNVNIKAEPGETQDDLEQAIPRSVVQADSATSVEFVDLTNDEFFGEFQHFLENVQGLRKEQQKTGLRRYQQLLQQPITEVMSVQVAHLQLISFYQEAYVFSLFGVNFKNVMVYGRITPGTVRQKDDTHIYKLDDGTGTVEVRYAHGQKRNIDNLNAVRCCEDTLNTGGTPLNEDQLPADPSQRADLQLLLQLVKTRCQQRIRYFRLGDHCFAIGQPSQSWAGRVSLSAHSMHKDDGQSTEIFWKTHLAQCYEERYAKAILG